MNRRPIIVCLVAMALAIAAAAPPASTARAAQIITPNGVPLTVDVSKGLIIRLNRPCASVFVADPDIADVQLKSPTMLYVMGKSAGETTIYAVDAQDAVLLNSRIEVHQDIDRLQRDILQMDPGSKVQAKAVDDSIVLQGSIKDAAEGDDIRKIAARYVANPSQLVNKLTLDAPNQIDLQVRVAEVQRSVLKQFGINWFNMEQSTLASFGFVSATQCRCCHRSPVRTADSIPSLASTIIRRRQAIPHRLDLLQRRCGFNTPTQTLIGSGANNNLFASFRSGDFMINALVDALAQNGLITILAEPNLVTVSGQKASFLAGGEFPVPVPQSGGTGSSVAITIDWKKFGVSLDFTPTIMADGRIALHVAPEVSELSPSQGINIQGVSVPGITTRRADTTVELGSGQTFAIAGLLQNQTQQQLQAYPWIGDVPIIGALFRSTAFQRGETELVILVTPYMVKPVSSATALKTDNDGFYAPTDASRVGDGTLNAAPASTDPAPAKPATPTASVTAPAPARAADGAPATPVALGRMPTPRILGDRSLRRTTAAIAGAPQPAPLPAPPPAPKAIIAVPARTPSAGFEID